MDVTSSDRWKIPSPTAGNTRGPTPPMTPRPAGSPCPTTFVQADASSFKNVVQMLTGSSVTAAQASAAAGIPPVKTACQKKPGFKLYERRSSIKTGFVINTPSPGAPDFPAPMTPLNGDSPIKSAAASPMVEEEKAIAEKKFYLHPSPRRNSGDPELLHLFPMTSPRVSWSSMS